MSTIRFYSMDCVSFMALAGPHRWRDVWDWFPPQDDLDWPEGFPRPDYSRLREVAGSICDRTGLQNQPDLVPPPQSPELLHVAEVLDLEMEELQAIIERLRLMSQRLGGTAFTVAESREIAAEAKRRWIAQERRRQLERRHTHALLPSALLPDPVMPIDDSAVIRSGPVLEEIQGSMRDEMQRIIRFAIPLE